MHIDNLGFNIGSQLNEQFELLQPQIEQFYNIKHHYSDILGNSKVWSNLIENMSSASGLSNLGVSSAYNQLISEMRKIASPEILGVASAVNEFSELTAALRESISYTGISSVLEAFHSSIPDNINYASWSNAVVGLSRIFNDDLLNKLQETFDSLNDCVSENPGIMKELFDTLSEEEYEGYSIDDQGNISCNGSVITLEEVRQIFLDSLSKLIDWLNGAKIEFGTKHKIICFVITVYIDICFWFGIVPVQPIIAAGQKVISMVNNYDEQYYVSEENVRVYANPTSKSEVIYRLSYGETVVSEENAKGWIKVSIPVGDEVYQGWIAKRNLVNYNKAKFYPDELDYEVE